MANRPGRPPLDPADPSVVVSLRITTKTYDSVYRRAQDERSSVSDVIRRALRDPATKVIVTPQR